MSFFWHKRLHLGRRDYPSAQCTGRTFLIKPSPFLRTSTMMPSSMEAQTIPLCHRGVVAGVDIINGGESRCLAVTAEKRPFDEGLLEQFGYKNLAQ
jgi:hypothetical protein